MAFFSGKVLLKDFFKTILEKIKSTGDWQVTEIPIGLTQLHTSINADFNGIRHSVMSGYNYSSNAEWYAFNKDIKNDNKWEGYGAIDYASNWLGYDFGYTLPTQTADNHNKKVVNMYSIKAYSSAPNDRKTFQPSAPKRWKFQASHDKTNWVDLHQVDNEINWLQYERRFFNFENTTPYRYYRILIGETNGTATQRVMIDEMDLYDTSTIATQGAGGAFFKSVGSSGQDNINVYIGAGNLDAYAGNAMEIAMLKDFDPVSFKQLDAMFWHHATAQSTAIPVNYTAYTYTDWYLDVSKDRILFVTCLEPSASNPGNNYTYLGLLKRISQEMDSTAMTLSNGFFAPTSYPKVMRNKANTSWFDMTPIYMNHSYSPSVWGDYIFVSPIFLEGAYEGIRGEMEGLYTCRAENLVDQDEVVVGDSRYKVIMLSSYNNTNLPFRSILLKMP